MNDRLPRWLRDHAEELAETPTVTTQLQYSLLLEAAAELEHLQKATGGLPPELVVKALIYVQIVMQSDERWADVLTDDEFYALATATFEVPT